jgi:hypothetical protein
LLPSFTSVQISFFIPPLAVFAVEISGFQWFLFHASPPFEGIELARSSGIIEVER